MGLSIYCTFVSTHKVLNFEIYDEVLLSNLTVHLQNDITYLISSTQVHAHFYLQDVCKHFAFGDHVRKNFPSMPELPGGAQESNVIAIPEKPSHKAKPHYFLCNNETELQ